MSWYFFYPVLRVIYIIGFVVIPAFFIFFAFYYFKEMDFPNILWLLCVGFLSFYAISIYYLRYYLPQLLKEKIFEHLNLNKTLSSYSTNYFSDDKKLCSCYFDDKNKIIHIFTLSHFLNNQNSHITTQYDNLKLCNVLNNKKVSLIFHQKINNPFHFYFDLDRLTGFVTKTARN